MCLLPATGEPAFCDLEMTQKQIRFQPLNLTNLPIEVDGISPEQTVGLSAEQIKRLPIRVGNQTPEVGELFDVSENQSNSGSDLAEHHWQGELHNVDYIGQRMKRGSIQITGSVGVHLGAQMSGGTITVSENAADFAGSEMTGGSIFVGGNAGDWLGAAYPGNKIGMNRGTIVVGQDAGCGCGFAMRRGTIFVQGNVGRQAGWNMRAGSILIGGHPSDELAAGMVRGTVLVGEAIASDSVQLQLGPTFVEGIAGDWPITRMLGNWLTRLDTPFELNVEFLSSPFSIFHGDQLQGGRGEVMVRVA